MRTIQIVFMVYPMAEWRTALARRAAIGAAGSFTAAHTIDAKIATSSNTRASTSPYLAVPQINVTNCAKDWDTLAHWKIRFHRNPKACIGRHIGVWKHSIEALGSDGAWTWLVGWNERNSKYDLAALRCLRCCHIKLRLSGILREPCILMTENSTT